MNDLSNVLKKRVKDTNDWIRVSCPEITKDQKHLDSCTSERAYWHYGYMIALRDVLRLIGTGSSRKPSSVTAFIAVVPVASQGRS